MGLGFSVEQFGKMAVGEENKHIVKEAMLVATGYIAVRYLYMSVTKNNSVLF